MTSKKVAVMVFAMAFVAGAWTVSYAGASQATESEKELALTAEDAKRTTLTGEAERGWSLFRDKGCVSCHAVWGQGGVSGPDLGRTRTLKHTTAGQLAGVMWNHVPRMWERMEEGGMELTPISPEEMSHLFALLLFIRYADEPGDADSGKKVLNEHQCTQCHSVDEPGETVGPDLVEWARYVNPVVWAQKMWTHADAMKAAMDEAGIAWPEFRDSDLNDVVAYVRSRAASGEKEYLEPGSISRGKQVFEVRGCASCHTADDGEEGAPDLERIELPDTLSGIAARLWNHAPRMLEEIRRTGAPAQELQAQEMADVITFLIARRYFFAEGDAEAGGKVFLEKQCVRCHAIGESGGDVGPGFDAIAGNASPVLMAHAMWRFGQEMLGEMAKVGVPWPRFEGNEMADLIAFLNRETRGEK